MVRAGHGGDCSGSAGGGGEGGAEVTTTIPQRLPDAQGEKSVQYYHKVDENVCKRKDLSQTAKLVLGVIQSFIRKYGVCFASDGVLGAAVGVEARQAKRAIAELAVVKLLLVMGSAKTRRLRPISVINDQNDSDDCEPFASEVTPILSKMTGEIPKTGQKCQGKPVRNDHITQGLEHSQSEHTRTETQPSPAIVVVASELCSFGVSEKEANALAIEYGADVCRKALTEAKAQAETIRKKGGWIRSFIRQGWKPSTGTSTKPPQEDFKPPIFRLAPGIPGDELAEARKARMDNANNTMMTADTSFARKWREDRGIAHPKKDHSILESMGAAE